MLVSPVTGGVTTVRRPFSTVGAIEVELTLMTAASGGEPRELTTVTGALVPGSTAGFTV